MHIGVLYKNGQALFVVMKVTRFIVFQLVLLKASKVMPTGHLLN